MSGRDLTTILQGRRNRWGQPPPPFQTLAGLISKHSLTKAPPPRPSRIFRPSDRPVLIAMRGGGDLCHTALRKNVFST